MLNGNGEEHAALRFRSPCIHVHMPSRRTCLHRWSNACTLVSHPAFALLRFRPVWGENGKPKVSSPSYDNMTYHSNSQLVQVASVVLRVCFLCVYEAACF